MKTTWRAAKSSRIALFGGCVWIIGVTGFIAWAISGNRGFLALGLSAAAAIPLVALIVKIESRWLLGTTTRNLAKRQSEQGHQIRQIIKNFDDSAKNQVINGARLSTQNQGPGGSAVSNGGNNTGLNAGPGSREAPVSSHGRGAATSDAAGSGEGLLQRFVRDDSRLSTPPKRAILAFADNVFIDNLSRWYAANAANVGTVYDAYLAIQPTAILVDEAALLKGQWASSLSGNGTSLFREIETVLTQAKRDLIPTLLINRAGAASAYSERLRNLCEIDMTTHSGDSEYGDFRSLLHQRIAESLDGIALGLQSDGYVVK